MSVPKVRQQRISKIPIGYVLGNNGGPNPQLVNLNSILTQSAVASSGGGGAGYLPLAGGTMLGPFTSTYNSAGTMPALTFGWGITSNYSNDSHGGMNFINFTTDDPDGFVWWQNLTATGVSSIAQLFYSVAGGFAEYNVTLPNYSEFTFMGIQSGFGSIGTTTPSVKIQVGASFTNVMEVKTTAVDINGIPIVFAGSSSGTCTLGVQGAAGTTTINLPVGNGANGDLLTTDGSGNTSWSNISAGATPGSTIVSTKTASNSATTLAWTGLTSSTAWKLVGRLLIPATNTANFNLLVGTGAGPSYVTSNYFYSSSLIGSGGFGANTDGEAGAAWPLFASVKSTGAGVNFDFTITTDNANYACIMGTMSVRSSDGHQYTQFFGGSVAISAAITAIEISTSTGNINTGNATLYALAS